MLIFAKQFGEISNILLKAVSNKRELSRGTSEKLGFPDLQYSPLLWTRSNFCLVDILNLCGTGFRL